MSNEYQTDAEAVTPSSPEFTVEQKNSFKLTKNTKGFNYEFKIIEDNLEELKRKVLELNEWAKTNFI